MRRRQVRRPSLRRVLPRTRRGPRPEPGSGSGHEAGPTIGVEEEFFLVDSETGLPLARSPEATAAGDELGADLHLELTPAQLETNTEICTSLAQVREQLTRQRELAVGAAAMAGARLMASGTLPVGRIGHQITDLPRYKRMARLHGTLADDQEVCGCHVHIGMPDRATAVAVANHLRPWLPVLLAIAANSPFYHGRDTRHASWRWVLWSRWPTSGAPPYFRSLRSYEATVAMLLDAGAAMDEKMVYFDARPSAHLPTLEVRVSDVAPTVDDAVLIAGLIRGLAGVALADVAAGRSAEPISELAVRAANWTAARGGLSGTCLDPVSRRSLPARDLAGRLLERAAPALAAWGELAEVGELLRASLDGGCGADRQRVAFRDGGMAAVVDMLVARTAPAVADRVGGEHDHTP